jgi:acetylglutamate/LysW-gamma-L-alpha-aminoadipate kinase
MIIVKIGGGENINIEGIVNDLACQDQPFLVIHGANVVRDHIAEKMGFTKQVLTSASGYSSVYSDENAIDAILMAYSGLRNKRLVELFQRRDINAVGLSGIDGRVIQGVRNKGIRVIENGKKMIKRDLSGKPKSINVDLLNLLITNGYTPVLTIPICDENGFAINSENDDIVCELQSALSANTVIQLIEAEGYLDDFRDPDSIIRKLSRADLVLREEAAEGRIKRKLHALNKLSKNDVEKIIICDGRTETPISDALAGAGTWIQ